MCLRYVERLDAERIASQQNPAAFSLIKGERKHAVELIDRLFAPG